MFDNLLFKNGFNSERIQWIDNAKGICMFLVIVVHSGYMPELYKFFLEPFFLAAFFFISGFLFHDPTKKINLKLKILKILETILVPYLLYWILSYSLLNLAQGEFNAMELFKDILGGNKLWFIAALLISQLLFSFLLAINTSVLGVILFSLLSVSVWYLTPLSEPSTKFPWSINDALIANFFIGAGYIIKNYEIRFYDILKNKIIGIIFCIIYLVMIYINFTILRYPFNFPANKFGNILVFIPYALVGIFCVLFVSNLIRNNYLLIFIGMNSLLFYFYQNQVLKILKMLVAKINIESPDYLIPPLMAILVVLALIIPILITNKYLPIMTGKNKVLSKLYRGQIN